MLIRLVISILFIFLPFLLRADGHSRGYTSVSIGTAIPIESFASTEANNARAGFAKPGSALEIAVGLPLYHSNLGFCLDVGHYRNKLDVVKLAESYHEVLPQYTYDVSASKPISMTNALLGIWVNIPFRRFIVDIQAKAGVAKCTVPSMKVLGSDSGKDFQIDVSGDDKVAFCFGGEIAGRYFFTKKLAARFGIGYVRSNADYEVVLHYLSNGSYTKDTFDQPTVLISIKAGLALSI